MNSQTKRRKNDDFQNHINHKLRLRGFRDIANNRGLIGAVIDETILQCFKAPSDIEEAKELEKERAEFEAYKNRFTDAAIAIRDFCDDWCNLPKVKQ